MKKSGEGTKVKGVKNLGASVRAQLLNVARQADRDVNAVLLQYIQERFLYRVSISPYKSAFILKGALLLLAYQMSRLRPTKDIDFLGLGVSNNPDTVRKIVQEIARIESDDAVRFIAESVGVEGITEDAEYNGVRVKLEATLERTRSILRLDIGFGDQIVAGPVQMDFPVLLDMPMPTLQVYSIESSIAEKFQALVKLNIISSRMKDIYDILFHAQTGSFRLDVLQEALKATFSHRELPSKIGQQSLAKNSRMTMKSKNNGVLFSSETASIRSSNFRKPSSDSRALLGLLVISNPNSKRPSGIIPPGRGRRCNVEKFVPTE